MERKRTSLHHFSTYPKNRERSFPRPVFDNSTNKKLSDRLPFLFGKACYVFRSENALYGTGHIIGRMMIMKTALLLNTL